MYVCVKSKCQIKMNSEGQLGRNTKSLNCTNKTKLTEEEAVNKLEKKATIIKSTEWMITRRRKNS